MKRELTCIGCPMGCALTAVIGDDGTITVTGNTCPRGEKYAKAEITNPVRTVTSTVTVRGGEIARLSVRTSCDIPKDRIMDCMAVIRGITVDAPVTIGTVLLKNCCGTDADIIATKTVARA